MSQPNLSTRESHALAFLAGGGEMGARTREFAWDATPLGSAADWPHSLKTVVRVMLDSRYAMWLGWGPDFTFFYNDAYARMTLGPKHPWALGRSAREVWSEIWDDIGPRAESVVTTGEATWDERLMLILERRGFAEETYHTFSYSPVPDDHAGIGGMLCVVTEETERTIGERRLLTLRELATRTTDETRSAEHACQAAASILAGHPLDVPFTLIYLFDESRDRLHLAGHSGIAADSAMSPARLSLTSPDTPWPFAEVAATGDGVLVEDLAGRLGTLTSSPWPESPDRAIVLPLVKRGLAGVAGFIVGGISPRRPFDDDYRGFFDLLAGQIATAVASARAYEEERRRVEELAEIDRAKTVFFSNVSHEFRTPLTLLLGPVEEILGEPDQIPSQSLEMLGLVHRNALRLQKLVNTLLDFSRIEAGRIEASYEPTDLAGLTAELASNFRSACERSGLALRVDCPPLPEPVYLDRDLWEKIVLNLLSNAFKFTLEGGIDVAVRARDRSAELVVRDTGSGIPAAEMPRLFERFHRVEGTRGRTQEGSGIGLALVRELVQLHGGTIGAESVPGGGTTFRVAIPFGSSHLPPSRIGATRTLASSALAAAPYVEEALRWLPRDATAGNPAPSPMIGTAGTLDAARDPVAADESRPKLLLADDNNDMRDYLQSLLSGRYAVTAVDDGLKALEWIRENRPDLVLTDVMMPRLDGFGLLRELRDDPKTRDVPVLLLSARAGEEARVEGLEAGADDYLTKPFHARELLARVNSQVELSRLRREAEWERRRGAERSRVILESITDAFIAVDTDWRFSYVNRQAEKLLDRLSGDLLGKVIWDIFPGLLGTEFETAYRRAVAEREANSLTAYHPDDDRWYEVHNYPSSEGLSVYFRDVSETMRADERQRQLERENATANARFRAFFEQGALFAGIMTIDGVVLEPNRLSWEGCGFRREEIIGKPFSEGPWWSASREVRDRVRDGEALAARGEIFRAELPYIVASGEERFVDLILLPIKDEEGQVIFLALTGTDITDRKRAEAERHKFVSLAENSTDFIAMTDLDSVPTYINRAGLELVGLADVAEASRFRLADFFFLEDQDQVTQEFLPSVLERGQGRMEVRFRHFQTGQALWMMYHVSALTDPEGNRIGLATVSRDITDRRRLEDELRQLAADLSEADRRKDEFLATLAHELRNPLAPVRNGLEIMRLAGDDRSTHDEARLLIERQVAHMVRLIDDLMDISRITRGNLDLRTEPVDLATVVRSAVETSRPLVEAAEHELLVTLPTRPILVEADVTRLSQVFSNLLNNAAKYTEPGGTITLTVERRAGEVTVTITDNGIGIPEEMLPRIFDMFTQVDRSLERSRGGLGIGLTLVRTLTEMHGGRIEARSRGPGQGSAFSVTLPVVNPSQPRPAAFEPNGPPLAATRGRKILLVDDNRDSARTLARLLKLHGHEATLAHDGGEAVTAAEAYRPEIILLDIGLPVLNGYDVARIIRGRPWGREVTIVALTGWGQAGDRERSKEAGFDHHLVKPVDPAALEKLLAQTDVSTG